MTTVVGDTAVAGVLPGPLPARLNQRGALAFIGGGKLLIADEGALLLATF